MKKLFVGTDVGSTTVKIVCLDEADNVIYSVYQRHFSNVRETSKKLFEDFLKLQKNFLKIFLLALKKLMELMLILKLVLQVLEVLEYPNGLMWILFRR